ncbi:type VII secretion protein EccB [Dactylosporangium vinaceum]|uniref:Type VII secretion protein EccB n=1 Tax=Dactylosporangium vinaceum TaxID=53362 RepID=A0ABV5ML28_9ACTN|nr:type VII secretion protein EccB [Dactylosporangium vinaceum]UAB94031.1 type VII secretion protein EccB [Dactylosporangium vinaceum]
MATTRDHVAAYDYESRRRVTSLVRGEDEAGQDPQRRLNRTLVGSAVIAVLVMAGFGVAGLLGGGSGPSLPESGAVLVKGSGDRYVLVDGVLHPALNLSSAMLVGGNKPIEVRSSALEGKRRGLPVGIPGAPDGLPQKLSTGPWTVCVLPSGSQVVRPEILVLAGPPAPADGELGGTSAVLAEDAGTTWLVMQGRRYRLTGNTRAVLGLQDARPMVVPARVLDTLPEGPEIAVPAVQHGAAPKVTLPVKANVGDVVQTEVAGQRPNFSLVQTDGLSPITPLTATLLLAADSRLVKAGAGAIDAVASKGAVPGRPGWPKELPQAVDPVRGQPLCVSTTPGTPPGDAAWAATVSLPPAMPSVASAPPIATKLGTDSFLATSVAIVPGTGVLAQATTTAGQDGGYNLVTESGQRFPIVSADAVARLQLNAAGAARLPLPFIALLPSGPALDPQAAAQEYVG